MYGWRARIGRISSGTGSDWELKAATPEGISWIEAKLLMGGPSQEEFEAGYERIEQVALCLAERAKVDMIAFGGGPTSIGALVRKVERKFGHDRQLISRLESLTQKPVTTGITAQVEAMELFKVKRLVVLTPVTRQVNDALREFLEDSGFEVVAIRGMGMTRSIDEKKIPLYATYRFAREVFFAVGSADAILFPSAGFPAAPNTERLEQDLGVPVFTSSLCTLWACMRRLRIHQPIRGWGSLLERL
jgi:maleate cis-trans isomerase